MGLYQYACEKEGILWAAVPPTPFPVITVCVVCVRWGIGKGERNESEDRHLLFTKRI